MRKYCAEYPMRLSGTDTSYRRRGPSEKKADAAYRRAEAEQRYYCGPGILGYPAAVARAVISGRYDGRTGRKSGRKGEEKVGQNSAGPNVQKGLLTDDTADHHGVDGIIKLLAQASEQHWHGKPQYTFPRRAFGQDDEAVFVLLHICFLSFTFDRYYHSKFERHEVKSEYA